MNNTIHIHYEDQVVNAAQKITGVDCGNQTKHLYTHTHTHTHTLCGQNMAFVNVTAGMYTMSISI